MLRKIDLNEHGIEAVFAGRLDDETADPQDVDFTVRLSEACHDRIGHVATLYTVVSGKESKAIGDGVSESIRIDELRVPPCLLNAVRVVLEEGEADWEVDIEFLPMLEEQRTERYNPRTDVIVRFNGPEVSLEQFVDLLRTA